MSSMSCAYTAPGTVDTRAIWVDVDADFLQLCGLRPDVAGVPCGQYTRQSAFSGHRPRNSLCRAGPFSAGSRPVLPASPGRAARFDAFGLPLRFTLLSGKGVWGFPQAKRTARQGRDGAFFGSVATLPMLAVFVLLRYKYIRKAPNYPQNRDFPGKKCKKIKDASASPPNKKKNKRMVFRHSPVSFFLLVLFNF